MSTDIGFNSRTSSIQPTKASEAFADKTSIFNTTSLTYEKSSIKKPRGAISVPNDGVYSLFSDYSVLSLQNGNYPKTDTASQLYKSSIYNAYSAIDLIDNPRGASIFLPRDFLLCERYGLPINKMITLRRFPFPCGDDIFTLATDRSEASIERGATEPDIGRLVTYMDQELNKISDVCKFKYQMNWRKLTAETEDASGGMQGGDASGLPGFMNNIAAFLDGGTTSQNALIGENRLGLNPLADQNKIHGPIDVIAETNIRNTGLETDITFNIVFDYELKSFNGLNQKSMFLDLLSNILAVTYNNGKFWGGARVWSGARPSPWMRKMAFMNPSDANQFMNDGRIALKDTIKGLPGTDKKSASETLSNIMTNGLNLGLGKILDKVGRPSILVMNSLLNGDNTGEWHLTIGNPLNPIMSVGNLRMTNTEIEFGEILGYDDFPTKIKVTCTLEQGMSRDKAGIESMFNMGNGRTYWTPNEILKRQINGSITTDINSEINESQVRVFGDFTDSDILRSADMHSDFLRKDEFEQTTTLSLKKLETTYKTLPPPDNTQVSNQLNNTVTNIIDNDKNPLKL